ncbi:hypothetical protein COU57_03830 [Candidatus Pacearchaeota archaeon CG10_big_fil_rev_8_21_14_0_10_32_14]|nr:MAG: hypothetical protein COU57_03830 [Candidatus Pacearchaeota archaeon CG10_big_fil_rev_8_21_14_0_10_32_14]
MIIESILALLSGIMFGIFTGLMPGIHINLVSTILVSLSSGALISILPIYLLVFIVSMAISHSFLDFIPSIYLGASDDAEVGLAVLPGHDLLKEGRGHEAVMLSSYGSFYGIIILAILFIPLSWVIPKIYPFLVDYMAFILILFSSFLIFIEKNKIAALFVFIFTGGLGYFVLNLGMKEPLLPLLSGLFGTSMIIISIKTKTKIPPQLISKEKIDVPKKSPIIGSLIASPLCGFLPGLGGGQAASLASTFTKKDKKSFIVLTGITNSLVMGLSFVSLYSIDKARTGAAVSIQEIFGSISFNILSLIIIVSIIGGIISFYLTRYISIFFAKNINKIDYTKLSLIVLIVVTLMVYIFSGLTGLFVLILSTLTGIYCSRFSVRRTQYMGCLLLPTIIYYLIN